MTSLRWLCAVLTALICLSSHAETGVTERRYDWLTQGERSGGMVLRIHADGRRQSSFEFNDRGRGPKQEELLMIDADGLISSMQLSGKAYMGSPLDERFERAADGSATWQSTAESGQHADAAGAFYVASDGTPEQSAVLARALLASADHRLPLLPSGEARIEALETQSVTHEGQTREVTLFAVSGLGFSPSYMWLDADRELFALAYGWMGLTPEGWAPVLPELQTRQTEIAEAHHRQLAARLTHRLGDQWCIAPVRLLDIDAGLLRDEMAVRVSAGRISAVGHVDAVDCDGVQTLDGAGRVLMPGLWDMHAHVSIGDGLLNVAAGVVGVRDLANDHDRLMAIRAQMAAGEVIGTDIHVSGFIDQRSPFAAPTGRLAGTLEEAIETAAWYAERDYPHIKIYSSITPAWVEPLAKAIHRHGMTLSGHIPSGMTAEGAVRAGFDEIQHINMVFLNFLAKPEHDTRTPVRFTLVADEAGSLDLESAEVGEFIALLRERGTVVDPTVTIFDSMFRHRSGRMDPNYAMIAEHLPPTVRRGLLSGSIDIPDDKVERYAASADALLAMIKRLHDAGVPLVAGTDAIAGFTLLRELELYGQAGIPNADVLRLATIGAAKVLGVDADMGRIAPGYRAELILIDGDPLADLAALRRVTMTLRGDRYYRAVELHEAIGVKPFVAETAVMADRVAKD
jgi:imidazolonepropionase-like amidohydrolase